MAAELDTNGKGSSLIAEQARRRAEIARYYEVLLFCTASLMINFKFGLISSKLLSFKRYSFFFSLLFLQLAGLFGNEY